VTAPLHKEALAAAGRDRYPGHTELLQAEAAAHLRRAAGQDMPVRMMLANDELRTVLVSIHVSLRDAIDAVTQWQRAADPAHHHKPVARCWGARRASPWRAEPACRRGRAVRPRGDRGHRPGDRRRPRAGMDVHGPFAPDTVFMRARGGGEFDVVVAMYHDQGLIPVKYLGVEQGVNVTLGLPLVRTSPDHGTAFDIAGSGRADAASLIAAVRMARQLGA
jgi:4-hydroxythreonine-4-phosphate dehydrogenase